MALHWELIFHSLSDFLCPLFSEQDKRRRSPPCSHSCAVTQGPGRVRARSPGGRRASEPRKRPGGAQQLAAPTTNSPFSWKKVTRPSDTSAGG